VGIGQARLRLAANIPLQKKTRSNAKQLPSRISISPTVQAELLSLRLSLFNGQLSVLNSSVLHFFCRRQLHTSLLTPPKMTSKYVCQRCLTASRRQLNPSILPRTISQTWRGSFHRIPPSISTYSSRRIQSTLSKARSDPAPAAPTGDSSYLLRNPNNLFHPFSKSPSPDMRRRAAFIKQHAYCPHPSHSPTRIAFAPNDPEAKKPTTGGLPPAHVNFECPDCGVPVYCCEEHWADDYESHLYVCDILREINTDDHDLRSGREFPEFECAGPHLEEQQLNFENWDVWLYTREFRAINDMRSMRQATRMLTYPVTIGSVLHESSPYTIRSDGRLTPEGLKSFSALRYTLHPPKSGAGKDIKGLRLAPPPLRIFCLGARAESSLPRDVWVQLSYMFPQVRFHLVLIGTFKIRVE